MDVEGGFGGRAAEYGMDVQVGTIDGAFLMFSLQGLAIPSGYYHLTTLNIVSLDSLGCEEGTFGLVDTVISDPDVREGEGKGSSCFTYDREGTWPDSFSCAFFSHFSCVRVCYYLKSATEDRWIDPNCKKKYFLHTYILKIIHAHDRSCKR